MQPEINSTAEHPSVDEPVVSAPSELTASSSIPPLNLPLPASVATLLEGRLHPMTFFLGLFKVARGLIIPAIPFLFLKNKWVGIVLLALMSGGTLVTLLIRYFTFSYRIQNNELITSEGLFEKRERHIPLDQVQEIRIEQSLIQRAFDVVEAHVETAGGEGTEAELSLLARSEAERLREAVLARSARKIRQATSDENRPLFGDRVVLHRLTIGDLILAGLTSNHLLSGLALAGTLWAFADDYLPRAFYKQLEMLAQSTFRHLMRQGIETTIVLAMAGLFAVFLAGMVFSIIGNIILFYGFTLSRSGGDFYRSYGLLTRRASSLPRQRIQVLQIHEGLLRRIFKLATMRADISGGKREGSDDNKGRDLLMPIIRRLDAQHLLTMIFPDLAADQTDWRRVSPLAIRRETMKGGLLLVVVTAAVGFFYHTWYAPLLLLMLPVIYWINVVSYRHLGYAPGTVYFLTRRGWLGRSTHIVPVSKTQVIEIRQTPFDRRRNLATLAIDTAGQAYTEGGPRIGNLPIDEARTLGRKIAQQTVKTGPKF